MNSLKEHFLKNEEVKEQIRKSVSFSHSSSLFKQKAVAWADANFPVFTFLENNNIAYPQGGFQNVLAVGIHEICTFPEAENYFEIDQLSPTFSALLDFQRKNKDWIFGHFSYDLKNEIENLKSQNQEINTFPKAFFYIPQHLLFFKDKEVIIQSENPKTIFEAIEKFNFLENSEDNFQEQQKITIRQLETKANYLQNIEKIRNHILNGAVYELNYCTSFTAENVFLNPINLFQKLNTASPMPFAALHKVGNLHKAKSKHTNYLICASPERFLKKEAQKLISQPIKGTAKRGNSEKEDETIRKELRNNEKELAENMMIVDLVRNDLAKSSKAGTVKASELFGIYTFRHLHQMISTIESELKEKVSFAAALQNAFPMGSMTGAPKISAMELIEKYELTKRGLFSGSVGYISPEIDFDFNVIIRSIFYNTEIKKLSFQVGGAITYDSTPKKEYEECLLKAKAIIEVLGRGSN